ncbi:MAG: SUMF1/EgtB/PvdO family nonheme iron enzyme [Chloroflexota bacterium]
MLSILGDPRPGVGLGADGLGLPDILWCSVDSGLGNGTASTLSPFSIAQYPITHTQFKAFFDASDGYQDDKWWNGLGFGKQLWKNTAEALNAPADNIAWVNAMAFCRWLNSKSEMTASVDTSLPIRRDNYEIRLPTESEWMLAATGNCADYEYPWGANWISTCANSRETALQRSISVGLFPDGAAPCGALDMVGNTWEWCLNDPENAPQLDASGTERRLLCGGSYLDAPNNLQCSSRLRQHTISRNNISSFRIAYAVSLPVA